MFPINKDGEIKTETVIFQSSSLIVFYEIS